jgi:hypothetical protein
MRSRIAEALRRYLAVGILALAGCDLRGNEAKLMDACGPGRGDRFAPEPSQFRISFRDAGRLATVWTWGKPVPNHESSLIVSDASATRKIDVDRPGEVQWVTPDRLLYDHDWRGRARGRGPFVIDLAGTILRDFAAPERLESVVVSPDGRWIASARWDERGNGSLEVLPFDGPLEAVATRADLSSAVWSPDSSRLVAWRVALPRGVTRGIYGREIVLPRDLSTETPLQENRESDAQGYNHVVVSWWAPDGLYGIGDGALQRCDPDGSGCVEVFRPKVEGSLRSVTEGPPGVAYLLVNEDDPCFLEPGAREIHRLEPATGRTERLARAPEGVALTGIDWVDVPDAEPPVESPAASRKEK